MHACTDTAFELHVQEVYPFLFDLCWRWEVHQELTCLAQKDGEGRKPHVIMSGEKIQLFFFSRKWDMPNPKFTRTCRDWRSATTFCNYPVLCWYLKHPPGKLRGFHCVPKSWHISQFSNCCTETTAGCKTLESYLNMIQQNKNYIKK